MMSSWREILAMMTIVSVQKCRKVRLTGTTWDCGDRVDPEEPQRMPGSDPIVTRVIPAVILPDSIAIHVVTVILTSRMPAKSLEAIWKCYAKRNSVSK